MQKHFHTDERHVHFREKSGTNSSGRSKSDNAEKAKQMSNRNSRHYSNRDSESQNNYLQNKKKTNITQNDGNARVEKDNEDEIWDDIRETESDARIVRLQKRWSATPTSKVSDFCDSFVIPWLIMSNNCQNSSGLEEGGDYIVQGKKKQTIETDKTKKNIKILVDFGCGVNVNDTIALAQQLYAENWRVIAVEPYAPIFSALKQANVPSYVEVVRRDFLAGTGLCQRWWKTPIDVFYARNVFCSLDSDQERQLLWQFMQTKVELGGMIALQVCRQTPPFDDHAQFKKWLAEFGKRGFEVKSVCEKKGSVIAIKIHSSSCRNKNK